MTGDLTELAQGLRDTAQWIEQWPAATMVERKERPGLPSSWGKDKFRATLTEDGGNFAQVTLVASSTALAFTAACLRALAVRSHLESHPK